MYNITYCIIRTLKGSSYMELLLGFLVLPAIIYYTVKSAVEEGTYNALIKYDEYKKNMMKDI